MANGVDQDQTAPIGAVCSVSTLIASLFNSSVMLPRFSQPFLFRFILVDNQNWYNILRFKFRPDFRVACILAASKRYTIE